MTIHNFQFAPAQLTVHTGDTVEWKNGDIVPHTVTDADGAFDSGLIQPGATWRDTAKKLGTYHYGCDPHPNMQATLVVK